MKKYLIVLLFGLIAACTSDESKVQTLALESAKEAFHREVSEDIAKAVTGKENLQKTAANVLRDNSEFEVQKVELQGDSAVAVVQALTVPIKARGALIEIMGKLDDKKERNFNVNDALKMIRQQMELTETRSLQVYKVKLEKSGGWHVVKDSE